MNLREKYGEWGIILGATEGVGKAFAEKIASEGMSVVLVGRREEKLQELGRLLNKLGVIVVPNVITSTSTFVLSHSAATASVSFLM